MIAAPMAEGDLAATLQMRGSKLSVGGEMIYLPSVLTPIRHLQGVTPSTCTKDRGNTNSDGIIVLKNAEYKASS